MDPDQRALSSIQNTVGTPGTDYTSVEQKTLPQHPVFGSIVGRPAESQNTENYNPQELIARFNVNYGERSGLNPFVNLNENQGKNLHMIG